MGLEKKHLSFHLHENPIPRCCIVFKHFHSNCPCIKDVIDTTEFKEGKKINYFLTTTKQKCSCYDKRYLEAAVLSIFLETIYH